VITDTLGRPAVIRLTAGNVSDISAASGLLTSIRRPARLIADKGYDSDALRKALTESGTKPVIPGRRNRKRNIRHDRKRYRDRHLVENAFCRLKDFRRIATRYDKLAANFLSAVAITALIAFWV